MFHYKNQNFKHSFFQKFEEQLMLVDRENRELKNKVSALEVAKGKGDEKQDEMKNELKKTQNVNNKLVDQINK